MQYDRDASDRLLAAYVTPDVAAQRSQVLQAFGLHPGERVLDVGSGPGFLAAMMADVVGPSGQVCGIDISELLLEAARAHCAHRSWVEFRLGDATKLPFPDDHFDAAISTQVFEYLPEVSQRLIELRRVLHRGGRALILDTDWDSIVWHTTDPDRMARVLAAWDEHAADPHLPRTLARKLRQAGFQIEVQQIIPMFNPVFEPESFRNCLIDLILPFFSDHRGVSRAEAAEWARELRQLGEQQDYLFSLNRYLFLARKA